MPTAHFLRMRGRKDRNLRRKIANGSSNLPLWFPLTFVTDPSETDAMSRFARSSAFCYRLLPQVENQAEKSSHLLGNYHRMVVIFLRRRRASFPRQRCA